jgi:hypothetical protein
MWHGDDNEISEGGLIMSKSKRRLQGGIAPTLAVVAVVAAAYGVTTAYATRSAPRYEAVCVDPTTQERMPDSMCNGAPDVYVVPTAGPVVFTTAYHAGWYYVDEDSDVVIPGYYGRVSGGGWSTPGATIINNRTTINNTNITVNRGGVDPQGGVASKVVVKTTTAPTADNRLTIPVVPKTTTNPNISRGGFGVSTTSAQPRSTASASTSAGS